MKSKKILLAIGAVTVAAVVGIIIAVSGGKSDSKKDGSGSYRSIVVDDLHGKTVVSDSSAARDAVKGQKLKDRDNVAVNAQSDLTLALDTDKRVFAQELTRFSIQATGKAGTDSKTKIVLDEGCVLNEIDSRLEEAESYTVDTPNAAMSVRGTKFTVRVFFSAAGNCHTIIEVTEGIVEVTEKETGLTYELREGESAEVVSHDYPEETELTTEPQQPEGIEDNAPVYYDPEILAVQDNLQAYLDGGTATLDETNFDLIYSLYIFGDRVYVNPYNSLRDPDSGEPIITGTFNQIGDKRYGIIRLPAEDIGETAEDKSQRMDILNENGSFLRSDILSAQGTYTDLEFVKNMPNLTVLYIHWNYELNDITALKGLHSLETLYLSSTNYYSDSEELEAQRSEVYNAVKEHNPDFGIVLS